MATPVIRLAKWFNPALAVACLAIASVAFAIPATTNGTEFNLFFAFEINIESIILIFGCAHIQLGKPGRQADVAFPVANAHNQFIKDAAMQVDIAAFHQWQGNAQDIIAIALKNLLRFAIKEP